VEERTIIVAQGIERHSHQLPEGWRIPSDVGQRLRDEGLGGDIESLSDSRMVFLARSQGVRYTIRVITRKDEFKAALETPGVHVVYGGHARYGRGPCFGNNDPVGTGEDWGGGSDPDVNGIFPMGYPYLAVPIGEIASHQYTAYPVVAGRRHLPRRDRDKYIRRRGLRRIPVSRLPENARAHLAGVDDTDRVWGYVARSHGAHSVHIVLHAGWEHTGEPMDLGATNMQCRVFCHMGCSTFDHNYRVMRFLKSWRRQGNDRFAYWTTKPSTSWNRIPWLYHLLTYRRYNAFRSWHPHLRHAVRQTNREPRLRSERYAII
jgi:hypothetical protein